MQIGGAKEGVVIKTQVREVCAETAVMDAASRGTAQGRKQGNKLHPFSFLPLISFQDSHELCPSRIQWATEPLMQPMRAQTRLSTWRVGGGMPHAQFTSFAF